MLRLYWYLLKAFGLVFITLYLGRWLANYYGYSLPQNTDWPVFGIAFIWAVIAFVAGLSIGLIWGEENGRKTIKHSDYY